MMMMMKMLLLLMMMCYTGVAVVFTRADSEVRVIWRGQRRWKCGRRSGRTSSASRLSRVSLAAATIYAAQKPVYG